MGVPEQGGGTRMIKKQIMAPILILIGLAFLILSLTADTIGIGRGPGFGWAQILGSLAGIGIAAVGAALWRATRR